MFGSRSRLVVSVSGHGHGHDASSISSSNPPLSELKTALDRMEALVSKVRDSHSLHCTPTSDRMGGGTAGGSGWGDASGRRASTTTATTARDGVFVVPATKTTTQGTMRKSLRLSTAVAFGSRRSVAAASSSSSSSKPSGTRANGDPLNDGGQTMANDATASESALSSSYSETETETMETETTTTSTTATLSARFARMSPADEEELIELLRRSAELVVRGERMAARGTTMTKSREMAEDGDDGDGDGDGDDNVAAEKGLAVFEYFCERNVLALIVNLVAGRALRPPSPPPAAPTDNDNDNINDNNNNSASPKISHHWTEKSESERRRAWRQLPQQRLLLPPLSVATQAVQSVSILIQNVVRATSLYFLLSNNVVNDLIDLPLEMYAAAEEYRRLERVGKGLYVDSSPATPSPLSSSSAAEAAAAAATRRDKNCSAEMSELTTHFVSFCKSLAMRMNAETLQFFLTYPSRPASSLRSVPKLSGSGGSGVNAPSAAESGGGGRGGDGDGDGEGEEVREGEKGRVEDEHEHGDEAPTCVNDARNDRVAAGEALEDDDNRDQEKEGDRVATAVDAPTEKGDDEQEGDGKKVATAVDAPTEKGEGEQEGGGEKVATAVDVPTEKGEREQEVGKGEKVATAVDVPTEKGEGEQVATAAAPTTVDDVCDVDFPLYARALHFCSMDHDPFVRVTAMNICLNTLRLAVRGDDNDDIGGAAAAAEAGEDATELVLDHDGNAGGNGGSGGGGGGAVAPSLNSPDGGSLLDAAFLPLRERLAIARHVSAPSRVEGLVSPMFARLAQLCASAGDAIRSLDELDARRREEASEVRRREGAAASAAAASAEAKAAGAAEAAEEDGSGGGAHSSPEAGGRKTMRRRKGRSETRRERKAREDAERKAERSLRQGLLKVKADSETRRRKLVDSFRDTVADLQDELLLLEDVLQVGLTAVNEQIIEMMLATFIYPVLLQPLYLYMQRYPASSSANPAGSVITPNSSLVLSTLERPSTNGLDSEKESNGGNKNNFLDSSEPASGSRDSGENAVATRTLHLAENEADESHPFSLESIRGSLARYGLLSDETDLGDNGNNDTIDKVHRRIASESDNRQLLGSGGVTSPCDMGASQLGPDPAPAKTALFAISCIFHTLTNKPLLNLLFTAILHPLAPDTSGGGTMIITLPCVVYGDQCQGPNTRMRVDPPGHRVQMYTFGKRNEKKCVEESIVADEDRRKADVNSCVFVLSPALADLFVKTTRGDSAEMKRTRPNPYRRVALACLAGTNGMSKLQSLSVLAIDAALVALRGNLISDILFGNRIKLPTTSGAINSNWSGPVESHSPCPNHMVEAIASLSVGVVSASIADNGIWQLHFDLIAAHALLCASAGDENARSTAAKIIEHRQRQSSSFVSRLPAKIDSACLKPLSKGEERDGAKSITDDRNEQRLDLIMDRIFFDPLEKSGKCVLEKLVRKRTKTQAKGDWAGPCCVPVAMKSSLDDVCVHFSRDPDFGAEIFETQKGLDSSIRMAARSAFAHLQLDAFSKIIKEQITGGYDGIELRIGKLPTFDQHDSRFIKSCGECDDNFDSDSSLNAERTVFAPVSESLSAMIFEDEDGKGKLPTKNQETNLPETGSVVGLIGKAAFPCVCEVADEHASLFMDKGACVVAEGVKWQSLYLVLIGRNMVLAEPEKGGSGGNGRIVTSCHLSRLLAEKDNPQINDTVSPARRLLLTHSSPDPDPPGIFTADSVHDDTSSSVFLTRSRMDLWFEDATALGHAYKVLFSKINKARSRRGRKIHEVIMQDDRLRTSSLFNDP